MKNIVSNTLSILSKLERLKLFRFIFLNVLISIIDIASLAFLVLLIGIYTGAGLNGRFASDFKWIFDTDSMLPISIFILLFILKSIFGYWIFVAQYKYVYKVASRISESNLLKYLEGNYNEFVQIDSSVQIKKILHQPIEFGHYILIGILQIASEGILSAIALIVIMFFNAKLFLLLTIVLLPPVIIVSFFTKRLLKQARTNAKRSSEKTIQHLQEALHGYIESNIYDKSAFFVSRFSKYQQKMTRFLASIQTSQGIPPRVIEGFAVAGLFIIILAGKLSGNGSYAIEIINIGAFMAAAYKIIPGMVKIINGGGQIKTYEYTVNDLLLYSNIQKHKKNEKTEHLESIKFRGVSFSHDKNVLLENYNFEIHSGDFIGVSGLSGKGKTTLINLLLGFLSPDAGDILINNSIVSSSDLRNYWKDIGYVQQRPFLIYDSIRNNITLKDEDGDDPRLQEILKIVGLDELLKQNNEGIDRLVSENGKNISGGQRQRIALARALYKDAEFIILDEPFSELDVHSEQQLLTHLKSLASTGKMILMITHKKENLTYCNKTYVID